MLDFGLSLENDSDVPPGRCYFQPRLATLSHSVSFRVFRGPIYSVSFPFRVFRVFRGHPCSGSSQIVAACDCR